MASLPHAPRIVVVGTSAVGKSTFARALAAKARLPYVELDELHWSPDWREKPTREFAQLVDAATTGPSWVVDGNYGVVRELLWPRANLILWLNYGFARTLWRGLRRSLGRLWRDTELWHGNHESWQLTFLSKHSILLWIVTTHTRRRREFVGLRATGKYAQLEWVEFKRPAEAERWLSQLGVP
jgi:adenylate kinase family enzyme